jgi:hypothetical protein
MGRSGYNGGDPGGRRRPKKDNVHIFAAEATLDRNVLQKSRIVQSGEGLRNEDGGIQEEFGYILRLKESEEGLKVEEKQKLNKLKAVLRGKRKEASGLLTWIAASELLNQAPEGTELARTYHLEHPDAPQPWGFKQLSRTS